MTIQKILLKNFRNFENLELDFSAAQTLIVGANGSGKSNLLEAIYFMASGHSRRAEVEAEMMAWGAPFAQVQAQVGDNHLDLILSLNPAGQVSKVAKTNGVKKPLIKFLENLSAVEFSPEDLDLVLGEPSLRRRYLNGVLSQVRVEYHRAWTAYEKTRHEKNALLEKLRQGLAKRRELEVWNKQLLDYGLILRDDRRRFLDWASLNERGIGFEYWPSRLDAERLEQLAEREIAAGTSLIGPHRDDFEFVSKDGSLQGHPLPSARGGLKETNLAHFGSRGQQRMAVFTLKMREWDFVEESLKIKPVLLLDDIFSELDKKHRAEVLERVRGHQLILTTSDLNSVPQEFLSKARVIEI